MNKEDKMSKKIEFLKAYEKLCRKHGFYLHGCGCCGTPSLCDLDDSKLLAWREGFNEVCFDRKEWCEEENFNKAFLLEKTGEIVDIEERKWKDCQSKKGE